MDRVCCSSKVCNLPPFYTTRRNKLGSRIHVPSAEESRIGSHLRAKELRETAIIIEALIQGKLPYVNSEGLPSHYYRSGYRSRYARRLRYKRRIDRRKRDYRWKRSLRRYCYVLHPDLEQSPCVWTESRNRGRGFRG